MPYISTLLEKLIEIPELYSVHYFEYSSQYRFHGESHDFWELVYVDGGTVQVTADERTYNLSRGQIIFHEPGEFHSLSANGVVSPNLVVVGFKCNSTAMDFFRQRIMVAGAVERALLARIVDESGQAFVTPLNDPSTKSMVRRENALPGGEQMIAASLEELLIRLIRQGGTLPVNSSVSGKEDGIPSELILYFEQRLDQPLTVEQICRDNMIGKSQLQKLFHQHTGGGVMDYFAKMKIKAARRMIREGHLNFTQIAENLGFQSVHYFSRRFKEITGMSPSVYRDSVKMLIESSNTLLDNRANNV